MFSYIRLTPDVGFRAVNRGRRQAWARAVAVSNRGTPRNAVFLAPIAPVSPRIAPVRAPIALVRPRIVPSALTLPWFARESRWFAPGPSWFAREPPWFALELLRFARELRRHESTSSRFDGCFLPVGRCGGGKFCRSGSERLCPAMVCDAGPVLACSRGGRPVRRGMSIHEGHEEHEEDRARRDGGLSAKGREGREGTRRTVGRVTPCAPVFAVGRSCQG